MGLKDGLPEDSNNKKTQHKQRQTHKTTSRQIIARTRENRELTEFSIKSNG